MIAALIVEAALLPHWLPVRWVPQVSFLILLFGAVKGGPKTGALLGLLFGAGQTLFIALPVSTTLLIYAALGVAAGYARRFVFLESPLAQIALPAGFGLLTELIFFWKMPWDDAPPGFGDFLQMLGTSNLLLTCLLSVAVYAWYDRRLAPPKRS